MMTSDQKVSIHPSRTLGEGLGHYARDRMGFTAREAEDLVRLDDELSDLPVIFRMYAAGRLGRPAAWLVAKVVRMARDNRTERAWANPTSAVEGVDSFPGAYLAH